MADTVIGASVEIEYKSIKDLKTALEGTEKQFKEMVDTFGEGSEQAQQAQKKLLSLQDGVNKKTEEYNDKVDAAAGSVSALNATVGGLQGALELTGLASEETEKALAKVTAALSVGDAVQNLAEFGPMIKTTFKTIKDSGVAAFKALRTAIGSTGIGLLVIALGVIVAYWDDIKAAVTGVTGEMKKLNIEAQEKASKAKEEYDQVSRIEESLKRQGYTERDILKLKIQKATLAAKFAKEEYQSFLNQLETQKLMAERNQKILAGIIKWLNAPLVLISMQVDRILKLVGLAKYAKLEESIDKGTEFAASFVFDPKDFEKKNEELKVKAQETQATLDGHLNQLQAMDDAAAKERAAKAKAAADKRRADNEKRQAEEQKLREAALAAQSKAEEDLLKSRMTAREVELFDLQKNYLEQKKTIEAGGKSTLALTELYNKQKDDILKKYREEELAKEKAYRDYLNGIVAESEDQSGMTEAEIARKAVEEKYKLRREEAQKQYPKDLAVMIALAKAERAELDKIDEDERQKKLAKDSERLLSDAADEATAFDERLKLIKQRKELENQIIFDNEEARAKFIKENEEATTKVYEQQYNARVQLARSVGDALMALTDIIGRETATGKAIAIAQATMNTFLGITEVWKSKAVKPEPFNTATKIAATITTAAGGFAAVKNIVKTQVPGGGGVGGGAVPTTMETIAPLQPTLTPALQGQALNAEAINALGNNAMRAYVLNSDIQNNSQRNAYLQRNARIG